MKTEPVTVGYYRVEPFNPASSKQVAALIRHCGLKMPTKRGENRETTESKYLRRFSKKHEVFKWVLECRERQKLLSSYMWQLDSEGRVHTTFGFHPSTWRKSSRNPNLQTIPKRNLELAEGFRRMIVAAPGCVLIEADGSAIEAVLVGYNAGSERYIRLAKAGIHGWLASHWLGCPIPYDLPDVELAKRCKEIKQANPIIYEACKRGGIHGPNYLLSPHGSYDEYAELFPGGLKQVKELHELYFSLPPGQDVRKWQQQTMERAHREHFLQNHFGYRHYFYDVFTWDRKREQYAMGSDAKRAVAFGPQSDACVDPRSKVLKADLTWVDAGSIQVGDELVGFDEEVGRKNFNRKFRSTIVMAAKLLSLPKVRVRTSLGDTVVSALHPFLVNRYYKGRYWTEARKLKVGYGLSFLCQPWEPETTHDAGYIAGFFDGEGWCTKTRVGFGQNLGRTLSRIQELLYQRGFDFKLYPSWRPGSKATRPGKTQMRGELGNMREALRFLGTVRPPRLLEKQRGLWVDRRTHSGRGQAAPVAEVLAIEDLGVGDVIALETTTKTFISDGMFSHNSAIQTEVLLSLAYGEHGELWQDCLRLIVHDSIISEVPDAQAELAIADLSAAMSQPWPELNGLSIGVEVSMGRNLAYVSPDNPDGMKTVEL